VPFSSTEASVVEALLVSSKRRFVPVPAPQTESLEYGVEVPMPMEPFVVKVPFEVVVALPPTQRLFETERLVVEALVNVETPETESVPVAVRLAAERLPEKRPLPCTESACEGVVEPIPTLPPLVAKYAEPEEVMAVVEAYGKVLAAVAVEVMAPPMARVEVAVNAPPKKAVPDVY